MPKHNNVIHNTHFHKEWQLRVKTWFNQPGQKKRRRNKRDAKAARLFPRPTAGLLRPVVRCPTRKYSGKLRFGKGFTIEELKTAGINPLDAINIGIAVDRRRKNRSEQSLQTNVARLKKYRANLIVFPRKKGVIKAGDSTAEECSKASQHEGTVLPITTSFSPSDVVLSELDTTGSVFVTLRRAIADARLIGVRKKRAELAAEEAALKKKK